MERKYSLTVGIALVIANMVGTGVFTSLGYQVGPLPSAFAILVLWLTGGIIALAGAFCYAEIATSLKRSGGEYHYLGTLVHPALGFVAGWISILVGFAGAISAVGLAIGEYSQLLWPLPPKLTAIAAVLLVTLIHLRGVRTGGFAQTLLTSCKLSLIFFFCGAAWWAAPEARSGISFLPQPGDWTLLTSPAFAISLVFVVYAYTGWNAAAYIAGNLENPARNLPRSLLIGTGAVSLIYLALNASFLRVADFPELAGQNDIGNVVAVKLFGPDMGGFFSAVFSIALLSTLSAMTIAGPRVFEAMGQDYPRLQNFARKNRFEMPYLAILAQSAWAIFLILVSSFTEIIQYVSISLSLFSLLTILSVIRLRQRQPVSTHFQMPLYPLPPLVFAGFTLWMIFYVASADPKIILYSLGTMLLGFFVWLGVRPSAPR